MLESTQAALSFCLAFTNARLLEYASFFLCYLFHAALGTRPNNHDSRSASTVWLWRKEEQRSTDLHKMQAASGSNCS